MDKVQSIYAFSKIKEIKVKKLFFERLYMFVVKKRV